jgi:hypothetical protein
MFLEPRGRGSRLALAFGVLAIPLLRVRSAEKVEFNRDVRPILSENCFPCHGPEPRKRKAKLRLDDRETALALKAIVPGKPGESRLIEKVNSAEPGKVMPPPETNKVLSRAEKELLGRWIAEGAEYQPHWAYLVPRRPPLPQVNRRDWVRNPLDAFILASLEGRGLAPSPEADPRTLARRLSLDLLGLPASPGDVKALAAEADPAAYARRLEKYVEGLLESPHFGERMAVPWLDLVRFSDTVGYHGDQNQNIFPYRDYVIDSFNRNKPFDRFTIEQLAGDLLPDPTTEALVATGFNRLNMMTREGGAQPKEYLAKYASDRVRTVSQTWLGSTMGCCECHDHKFDPFTARDFYSLAAFFADVKQWGVYQDYAYTPNPDLRGWSNDHPFPPEIEVESAYLKGRRARLSAEILRVEGESAARLAADPAERQRFERWVKGCREFLNRAPAGWITPPVRPANDKVSVESGGSLLYSGEVKAGSAEKFELELEAGWLASIRLEALPRPEHQGGLDRKGDGAPSIALSAALLPASNEAAAGNPAAAKDPGTPRKETPLAFYSADAEAKDERYFNGNPLTGVIDGWKTSSRRPGQAQAAVWLLDLPLEIVATPARLSVTVRSDSVGCIRLSVSPFGFEDPRRAVLDEALLRAVSAPSPASLPGGREALATAYLLGTGWDRPTFERLKGLLKELQECRDGMAYTMVTVAREPLPGRVLPRGNWQDESGETVEPAVPRFLSRPAGAEGRRLTRLDLAHWLVSPENPLTARVFVNRLWKLFFGAGLCGSVEDVGAQGEWPVHPALLDWLAVEFRESGWDVKHLVRLMVSSSVYRQDSRLRPELRDSDPQNRLLSSQNPRRLEAEFIRDNALAAAGLLNLEVGGPSARPYQPPGYYANLQFPDRDYLPSTDERQYRRGLYSHWQRTFLHPMLANFDAPTREECRPVRTLANTPQQALTLLNDPTFVEAARVLAAHALAPEARSDGERIDAVFERVLARPAREAERKSLLAFLAGQRESCRADPASAAKLLRVGFSPPPAGVSEPELAAWTGLCRVVLNLHESITRY